MKKNKGSFSKNRKKQLNWKGKKYVAIAATNILLTHAIQDCTGNHNI